jgi:hypothetical protein
MPDKSKLTALQRVSASLRRDDGMALATVVAISAILFLLATTLIMLVTQQQITTSHVVARNKALQVADAGITAYLYQLRYNSTYDQQHPTMGPVATTEGSWTVTASRETSGGVVTLRSVGQIPGLGSERRILAKAKFPSFSDYMIVMNDSYAIDSPFKIKGKVYSNGPVRNDGEITGHVYSKAGITGGGIFGDGKTAYCSQPTINFSGINADLNVLSASATYTGTNFPASGTGGLGYRVILNGAGGTYQKVTAVNSSTGALTLTGSAIAFTIPAPPMSGVLFFKDRVWIDGTYSVPVTVVSNATQRDTSNSGIGGSATPYDGSAFYIVGNLKPTNVDNNAIVCGLVAPGDISIPIWYDSMTNNYGGSTSPQLNIWAAMISQTGTLHCDNDGTGKIRDLYVCGARTAVKAGNFSGVTKSTMEYDFRLQEQSPPLFPVIRDGSMTVDSWVED